MRHSIFYAITGLLFFAACNNNDKKDGALVNNKGVDDYGVNYSMQCNSVVEQCDRKPGIEIVMFDKWSRDSMKAIPLAVPDTFILCCGSYEPFADTLNKYKMMFDSLKNAKPFGGAKESEVSGATIGVGGIFTDPKSDSIYTVSIGIQPHSTKAIIAFKDTTGLNSFTNKLDSLFRTCCLQ